MEAAALWGKKSRHTWLWKDVGLKDQIAGRWQLSLMGRDETMPTLRSPPTSFLDDEVLWDDGQQRFWRLHGSYARRIADPGGLCFEPHAISPNSECYEASCSHYADTIKDRLGGVVRIQDGSERRCDELPENMCFGSRPGAPPPPVAFNCPSTCQSVVRARGRRCFSPRLALPLFQRFAKWRWHSQAMQDSVLHLLMLRPDGSVPLTPASEGGPFFVEFGYSFHPHSNTEYLLRAGWRGVRFDLENEQPSQSLFREVITPTNIFDVFKKHRVPPEPDLVSIDIDSCDVWVFWSLTRPGSPFRPRVVQIEFNRHFDFDARTSLDCRTGRPPWSTTGWPFKDFYPVQALAYGASIRTIVEAGAARGYSLVWIERCYDVFLVRDDLLCSGEALPKGLEHFRNFTAKQGEQRCQDGIEWFALDVGEELTRQWLDVDFRTEKLETLEV
eukprot:TRINITY_DN26901_c0_g1_i9.p1 TRINITY_DN26901_c0_g1~~TRINITY_DN26901_c0_g1_i9.p1  ORF type:complete len:443 (-),score=36.93 TRINITY_DN26901_c0_g1_i9:316-1644(-)